MENAPIALDSTDERPNSTSGGDKPSSPSFGFWPVAVIALATLALSFRLFMTVSRHAVNALFLDQWELFTPYFEGADLWTCFNHQHGPHRQGLGGVLTWLIAVQSHWDTRIESFFIAVVLCLASVCALLLKRRLFCNLAYSDLIIPIIFLSPMQAETIIVAPNVSHGALPLLMIMLYGMAWTVQNSALKYGLVLLLNFLLIYTGFGIFMGLVTVGLLLVNGYSQLKNRRQILGIMIALVVALLSIYRFTIGYRLMPAVDCFLFPHPQPWKYPIFAGMMLSRFFGIDFVVGLLRTKIATLLGLVFLALIVTAFVVHFRRAIRHGPPINKISLVICALTGYCLLFTFNTAVGRLCLGLSGSQSPRYMTLVTTGYLGLYFSLLDLLIRLRRLRWRGKLPGFSFTLRITNVSLVKNCLAALFGLLFLHGHLPLSLDNHPMGQLSPGKRKWVECYKKHEEITLCDQQAGLSLYPTPKAVRLKEKLDFLKYNRLNFFSDSK